MSNSIILKRKVNSHFTVLPNDIIKDTRLSWKSLGLLVYLLSASPTFRLTLEYLSTQRGTKAGATRSGLKELEEAGYLQIEREQDASGRFTKTTWHVTDAPEGLDISPRCKNPKMDDPIQDHQESENPTLINTSSNKKPKSKNTTTDSAPTELVEATSTLRFPPNTSESDKDKICRALGDVPSEDHQKLIDELTVAVRAGTIRTTPLQWFCGVLRRYRAGEYNFRASPSNASPSEKKIPSTKASGQKRNTEISPSSVKNSKRSPVGIEHLTKLRGNRRSKNSNPGTTTTNGGPNDGESS